MTSVNPRKLWEDLFGMGLASGRYDHCPVSKKIVDKIHCESGGRGVGCPEKEVCTVYQNLKKECE